MLDRWALNNSKWKKRVAAFLYEDRHLHEAACIRALCDSEAESIRAYGLRNPICVIPNGVELPGMLENSKVESGKWKLAFGEGRKVLLYLGRLHPKKNLGALLKGWAEIRKSKVEGGKSEQWLLAIAGWDQGWHEDELKRLAGELGLSFAEAGTAASTALTSDLGLSTSVAFLGPQFGADKDECYRACDAFILPSLSEGLPMTVLEAWSYAKPVLMTPECNLPEGFAAGAALRIGTNANEIADGLKQLFEMNDGDRKAIGERGRALVAEKFSWLQIGEQMRAVYEWVLGGGAPPEAVERGK
jgi:poly(glycerol-phosphate) alpha-glucosyltransferase